MTLESVQFSVLARCPACGTSTPVNGIHTTISCTGCATPIRLSEAHWLQLIGDFIRDDLRAARGTSDDTEVLAPWGKFSVDHGHCDPVCPHCARQLPETTWRRLAPPVKCPACRCDVSVRPPPDWLSAVHPGARWLIGESHGERGQENSTRRSWSVLVETGPTGYVLPEDTQDFCDVAHAPDGGLVAAFIEEPAYDEDEDEREEAEEHSDNDAPIYARIVKFDQQGLIEWVRQDIDFDRYARLLCTPDGRMLALVLPGGEGLVFLDPASGRTVGMLDCPDTTGEQLDQPPEHLRPIQLYNAKGVELAPDGTIVVLRNGPADAEPVFTRYTPAGQPVPMWPAAPEPPGKPPVEPPQAEKPPATTGLGGFFRRLFGHAGSAPGAKTSGAAPQAEVKPETGVADWDALPDRLLVPPPDVLFTFSPGGDLILLSRDRSRLAHFDSDGKLVESRRVEGLPKVARWGGFGADELESVYLAYMPADYLDAGGGMHLIRLPLGGAPEVYRGWRVDPDCPLGGSDAKLKVRADGALYLGDELENVRVVSPEGTLVFRTPATAVVDQVLRRRYETQT